MGSAGVDIREIWDAADLLLLHSILVCTRPSQPLTAGCDQGNELEEKDPSNEAVSSGNMSCLAPESPHHPEPPSPRAPITQSTHHQWMLWRGVILVKRPDPGWLQAFVYPSWWAEEPGPPPRSSPRLTSTRTDLGCCGNPFSLCFLLQFLCQHLLLLFRLLWVTSKQRGGQSRS